MGSPLVACPSNALSILSISEGWMGKDKFTRTCHKRRCYRDYTLHMARYLEVFLCHQSMKPAKITKKKHLVAVSALPAPSLAPNPQVLQARGATSYGCPEKTKDPEQRCLHAIGNSHEECYSFAANIPTPFTFTTCDSIALGG